MNGDDQLYCVTCKSMRDMETASIICFYKLISIDKTTKGRDLMVLRVETILVTVDFHILILNLLNKHYVL